MIVTFVEYKVPPRFDGTKWTRLKIYESDQEFGAYNLIDTQDIDPSVFDPEDPEALNFTTDLATYTNGWYRVDFLDDIGGLAESQPVYNAPPVEIMASLDDINSNLDGHVIQADANNSPLVQVTVARIIRGYLTGVLDATTVMGWQTPETTPDIVRVIASKLIASQIYFNAISVQAFTIENTNYAQRLYDEAMAILNGIIAGTISLGQQAPDVQPTDTIGALDFFPVDATDRAFTLGMNL